MLTDFTVVIPVTHSLAELRGCLASLENLDYPRDRFRVALVDCGVVEGLQAFCGDRLPHVGLEVSLLVLPEPGRSHPEWLVEARMNEARNLAMRRCPAECFVLTEDDCTFERDWLSRIAQALRDDVGAIGGPDLLPGRLGRFAEALDFVLNSAFGSGRMRAGTGRRAAGYYPRKQNMAIPARVIRRCGDFPEDRPVSGEIEMARRVREAGLRVVYLEDNPVWHRRTTTLPKFMRLSAYIAGENVRLLRSKGVFRRSVYAAVLAVAILIAALAVTSLFSSTALLALAALAACYVIMLLASAVAAGLRFRSVATGLEVLVLIPAHHLSLVYGTTAGALGAAR